MVERECDVKRSEAYANHDFPKTTKTHRGHPIEAKQVCAVCNYVYRIGVLDLKPCGRGCTPLSLAQASPHMSATGDPRLELHNRVHYSVSGICTGPAGTTREASGGGPARPTRQLHIAKQKFESLEGIPVSRDARRNLPATHHRQQGKDHQSHAEMQTQVQTGRHLPHERHRSKTDKETSASESDVLNN